MISALSMHYRKEEELRKRRIALERWQQEQLARNKEIMAAKQKAISNTHLTASPVRPPQQSISEPALHKVGTNGGGHQETRQPSPSSAHSHHGRKSPNPLTCSSAQSKTPKIKRSSKLPKAKK
uniref:Uncharacterized protein n=1 Tax=Plectus sambesii TaxID=2011161 RepID=A0A914WFH9_9BILA